MSIVSAWKASPIKKSIFIVPFGAKKVEEAKTYLLEQGLAVFDTPEQAIKTFYYLYQNEHNIDLLFETPSNILEDFIPDKERAQRIIFQALKKGRTYLNLSEGFELLKAYGVPVPKYRMARNEEELLAVAEELGYPLSLCFERDPISNLWTANA
jgi:acetyltransferase